MVPSPEIRGVARWLLACGLVAGALLVTRGEVAHAAPDPTKQAERAAKKAEREAKKAEREGKKGEGKGAKGEKAEKKKGGKAGKAEEATPTGPATTPPAKKPASPAGPPVPAVPGPNCPPDNPLTFRSFGAGFLRTWCTGCHSSTLPANDRQDAPEGVDFDGLALFQPHAKEVLERAVLEAQKPPESASPMPPAGLVPEADRKRLAQWIECGAPAQ